MKNYLKVDQIIHVLCQIIAKANRTFVPKAEDDSHTNLHFDAVAKRMFGRWINSEKGEFILSINFSELAVEWLNRSMQTVQQFPIVGKTTTDLEAEIAACLPELGLKEKNFKEKLHFSIPEHDYDTTPIPDFSGEGLSKWMEVRQLGNEICHLFLGFLQAESEVRTWPHHFDTGIYARVGRFGIGFGLSLVGNNPGAPYFYMAAYPKEGSIEYQNQPELTKGRWAEGSWKGALLSLSELDGLKGDEKKEAIFTFLKEAGGWYLSAL